MSRHTSTPPRFTPVQMSGSASASRLSEMGDNRDHVTILQDCAKMAFLEAVRKSNVIDENVKRSFFQLNNIKESEDRINLFNDFYEKTDPKILSKVVEIEAKLQDILRSARKHAATNIVEKYKESHLDQSHSLKSELAKCHNEDVSAADVQKYLDEHFRAVFSLTGHPTNPTSLEYTKASYAIDAAFDAASEIDEKNLIALIEKSLAAPLNNGKKTPKEESEETMLALTNIYKSFSSLRRELEEDIRTSFYAEKIKIPKNLIELCVWTFGGDADGNDSITDTVLEKGYEDLRNKIKKLYVQDLKDFEKEFPSDFYLISDVLFQLENNFYLNVNDFIAALKHVEVDKSYNEKFPSRLKEFVNKVENFGFHFAKIDIRHNAKDLIATVAEIIKLSPEALKILDGRDFTKIKDNAEENNAEQEKILTQLFSNPQVLNEISQLDLNKISNNENNKERIIFSRLRICGENPGQTEKLIIADTTGAHHALAALFLLKVTGNKVAEKGAEIDVVTLSESIEDLKGIHDVQKSLMANHIYREHLKARGRIVQMIAKSDTIRVGGSGAEFYQDEAAGKAFLLKSEAEKKYGLVGLEVRVFNGGGAALQRGGGRPLEAAKRHAEAAIEAGADAKGLTTATFQGHQVQLLCGSQEMAKTTLEEAMTQNMHSALQVEKKLPLKIKEKKYTQARKDFYDSAIKNYQKKYFFISNEGEENAGKYITELFSNSNRAGVLTGNTSSRPNKRGAGTFEIKPDISVKDLYGENFDLFGTRAITLDRTLSHTGTFAVMFLGLREAFEELAAKGIAPNDIYKESKPFRDFIRNQVTALYMVDLDHAWKMMVGEKRPDSQEIKRIAATFDDKEVMEKLSKEERQKFTLAYLDCYINDVAKYIKETVTGKKNDEKECDLKSILRIYSVNLATEMDYREKEVEFLKFVEREMTNRFNHHPEEKLDEAALRTVAGVYAGGDVACNAPSGMTMLLTQMRETESSSNAVSRSSSNLQKSKSLVSSFVEEVPQESLPIPLCLRGFQNDRESTMPRAASAVQMAGSAAFLTF